eukprot:scaffold7454_cov77-Cyclotella_meneghiniana.AAC.5
MQPAAFEMLPRKLLHVTCRGRFSNRRMHQNNSSGPKRTQLTTTRSKQTTTNKKSVISNAISNNKQAMEETIPTNIFGMRPIDYTIRPPIHHTPRPPPPRPGMRKYIFPISLVVFSAITAYFYVNNKNDNLEFWMAMQTGEAVDITDDDDDDDDEDED